LLWLFEKIVISAEGRPSWMNVQKVARAVSQSTADDALQSADSGDTCPEAVSEAATNVRPSERTCTGSQQPASDQNTAAGSRSPDAAKGLSASPAGDSDEVPDRYCMPGASG
jgi:hypothetical protein